MNAGIIAVVFAVITITAFFLSSFIAILKAGRQQYEEENKVS